VTSQPETQSRIWVERSSVRSRFRWEGPLLVLVATVPDLSFVMPSLKARGMWHKPIKQIGPLAVMFPGLELLDI